MGLDYERKTGVGHTRKYIDGILNEIEKKLLGINNFIKENTSVSNSSPEE